MFNNLYEKWIPVKGLLIKLFSLVEELSKKNNVYV